MCRQRSFVAALAGCLILLLGCGPSKEAQLREVEVSPGQWVSVKQLTMVDEGSGKDRGRDRLTIPWGGQEVTWQGVPIPICLRQWEGKLFVIGFDRTRPDQCRLRYYRQRETDFEEISPKDFPKKIATQNMWLKPKDTFVGTGGRRYSNFSLTRELDVENIHFHRTETARIWRHLEKGEDYYQQSDLDEETVKEYKRRYEPIALPTIVKTPAESDGKTDRPSTSTDQEHKRPAPPSDSK